MDGFEAGLLAPVTHRPSHLGSPLLGHRRSSVVHSELHRTRARCAGGTTADDTIDPVNEETASDDDSTAVEAEGETTETTGVSADEE